MVKKKLLGEILIEKEGLNKEQLEECIELQKQDGRRIGEILLEKGYITETALLEALSIQNGVPYLDRIDGDVVDKELLTQVPLAFVKKNKMIPLYADDGIVTVAVADPLNIQPLDDISLLLHRDVEMVLTRERNIIDAINLYYHHDVHAAEKVVEEMREEERERGEVYNIAEEETEDLMDVAEKAPIIKLLNTIIFQAVKERASDIHIEATEKELHVRFRVDGVLYHRLTPPRQYQAAIASRVKIMAKLNIAERRLPQDGKIAIRVAGRDVDIRVSVIPTVTGERMVLRLLDRASVLISLEDLGMHIDTLEKISKLIGLSHGIILVTGPTGSGKTTTLYAALNKINSEALNIITIEDPVEYQLQGIAQIQVKPKIDLKFGNGLRSILRHDPDVIMVGEIRDYETAEMATHASLTGHLVFSTLHTNDAPGAVTRLVDMGVEPYLVSSSVVAILAQRLVRVACPECKEPYVPDARALAEIGLTHDKLANGVCYRSRGCPRCLGTGFLGRKGIFELLIVDGAIRKQVLARADSNTIKETAIKRGMRTLRGDGALTVAKGLTTIEEVMRVTQEDIF
jgi:general secretion pathway protein E